MKWHDNTHIMFTDYHSTDGVCKVLKVIGSVWKIDKDKKPYREPPVALNSMNFPFLSQLKARDMNTEVF